MKQGEGYIKIGVIGTGSIAHVQKTYIYSAYSPDEKELERYCDKFGITNDCKSVEELIENVDAV